ncbi:hypothetical protein [Solibacillus sp. CAU 1738]|uniref:hypothetical protein n=1 Tax=Solibacillus sp. CAU 1738 TaxID=3140363 RepID=UPI003260F129
MLLFFLLNNWHFFVLVMILMMVGGLISFLFPRFPSLLVILLFAVIGLIYAFVYNVQDISILLITTICIFTLIPIALVKYTLYLQQLAERLESEQ